MTVGELQRALDRLVRREPKAADTPVVLAMSGGESEWLDAVGVLPVHGFNPDLATGTYVELVGREGANS